MLPESTKNGNMLDTAACLSVVFAEVIFLTSSTDDMPRNSVFMERQ